MVGTKLGVVLQVEDGLLWDKCIRFRATIRLDKPLQRGIFVTTGEIRRHWVYFCYEKLPEFCYWCGFLGYSEKDYSPRNGEGEVVQWPYDPLMRASLSRGRRLCRGTQLHPSSDSSKSVSTGSESVGPSGVRCSLFLGKPVDPPFHLGDQSAQSDEVVSRAAAGVPGLGSEMCREGVMAGSGGLVPVEVLSEAVESVGLGAAGDAGLQPRKRGRPRIAGRRQAGRREVDGEGGVLNEARLVQVVSVPDSQANLDGGKRKSETLALFDSGMGDEGIKKGRFDWEKGSRGDDDMILSAGAAMQACREQ